MNRKKRARGIRRMGRFYNLFFIKPEDMSDAHESAKRLMGLEGVEEVIVTTGEYGFIVKSRPEEEDVGRQISKIHGGFSKTLCYYSYKR